MHCHIYIDNLHWHANKRRRKKRTKQPKPILVLADSFVATAVLCIFYKKMMSCDAMPWQRVCCCYTLQYTHCEYSRSRVTHAVWIFIYIRLVMIFINETIAPSACTWQQSFLFIKSRNNHLGPNYYSIVEFWLCFFFSGFSKWMYRFFSRQFSVCSYDNVLIYSWYISIYNWNCLTHNFIGNKVFKLI